MGTVNRDIEKFTGFRQNFRREVRERTAGYVTAALGLVAGLAWNEAIKSLIEEIFPIGANTLAAKFAYAILVTVIVVVCTVYLGRLFAGDRADSEGSER